ncbi:MAG: hypothetical protein ACOY94_07220 [Bacillota bacterium]
MIRAMEAHLAAWAQRQIQALSAESDLFGHVRAVPGQLALPPGPPLGATEVAALTLVESLLPQPEDRDLGPRPVTDGAGLHLRAQLTLRLLGRPGPYPGDSGIEISPAAAQAHRVDLAALTLLALLKEQPGPTPDGPVAPLLDLDQGEQPGGAAAAAHGSRRAHLAWTLWEVGQVSVIANNDDNLRQWDLALTVACQFRLSPAALEGGRILQIGGEIEIQNKPSRVMEAALYAPAEALALSWFDGLSDGVIAELSEQALHTLGDLGRLGPARVGAIAAELRTAAPAEESLLAHLATMAVARQTGLELAPQYLQDPVAFALPGRALLAPTPDESEILSRFITSVEAHAQIAMLALPVVTALKPPRREQVTLGTLLERGR